jgi:regulator of protease activity HflC (stomatin/prohibitin superfamily)
VVNCTQKRFPIITVQDISLLGPLRLPPDIQKSIDEQFAAQQAAQTSEANRRKVQAEAAANVAKAKGEAQVTIEQARAESESNRLRSSSVTPQLIELERLRVERARIEKWNGQQATIIQAPNVQVGTNGVTTPK